MAKTIKAERKLANGTVQTRQFSDITWDLLGADKGGYEQVKSAKAPEEVKKTTKAEDK